MKEKPILRDDVHSSLIHQVKDGRVSLPESGLPSVTEADSKAGQKRRMCLTQGSKVFMQITEYAQPV